MDRMEERDAERRESRQEPSRRGLLSRRAFFTAGVAAIGGISAALVGLPLIGYAISPLFRRREVTWVRACSLAEIDSITPKLFTVAFLRQNDGVPFEDVRGVFVIRRGDEILAFSNVCTHTECSVRWLDWHQQIICPCHGGIYDRWGHLMGGPPAHSLPLFETKIEGDDLYVANRYVFRV